MNSLPRRLRSLPSGLLPLYAGTVATRLGTFVVPYLTLYLSQDRGLSLSVTGRIIAAGGVGLLLGNLAGGWLADRVGRKTTLLLGLAINAAGMALLGSGLPSPTAYALALSMASVGGGMYTPAANAWIADLTEGAQRQLAYTVNYICINVGMGLGPLLGGVLAAASFHWLFIGDVATTAVCAAFIASASTQARRVRPSSHNSLPTFRLSSKTLGLLAFCCASFFIIAPLMGMEYTVPLFVGTVLHKPLVLVGVVYTINATCILLLGLPLERAVSGRDPLLMMTLAGVLWGMGLTVLAFGVSSSALLLCTVLWTLGEMLGSVVVPTFVANRVDEQMRGRILAIPDAMRSLAAIVAPIALGLVWERHGFGTVLVVLIATPLVGSGLYASAWALHRKAPR
ncbi:MAG: MFS transporter [Nannocystales bacterium]